MLAKWRRQKRAHGAAQAGWIWFCLMVGCGGRTELSLSKATLGPAQGGQQSQHPTTDIGSAQGGSGFESGGLGGGGGLVGSDNSEIAGQAGANFCDSGRTACGIGRRAFCAHLERDPANCGQCDRACSSNQYCSNGTCRAVQPCTGVLELGGWPEVPVPTTWSPSGMVLGDWNGDGVLDLAVADGLEAVNVLFGKGNGTFVSRSPVTTANAPVSLGSADLNGDGHADLVTSGGGTLAVLYGLGYGRFKVGPSYDTGASTDQWDTALALGDLNDDGIADVAVAHGASPFSTWQDVEASVSVLFGAADGTLSASTVVFKAAMGAPKIALGDVNGDGALDVAVIGGMGPRYSEPCKLTLLYGRGDGSFGSPVDTLDLPSIGAVAMSDLNRDGMADVILAGINPWDGYEVVAPQVSVLWGRRDNTLTARVDYGQAKHYAPALIAAEFSGDAFPDVAVTGERGSLDLLLGKADGSLAPPTGYGSGFLPRSVAAGDVNGDSVADLLIADESTMAVSVLRGQGYGAFVNPDWAKSLWYVEPSPASPCPLGCTPQLIADLDRDGWADLVASYCGSGDQLKSTSLCVLHGQGDGTFVSRANVQLPTTPQSVLKADLNGDAWPDLIAISYEDDNIGVVSSLIGKANGEFERGSDYPFGGPLFTGSVNNLVVLGDLNGDGLTDLLTLSNATAVNPGKATAWLGIGDGTFKEWREIIAVNGTGSVAIGDLNLDGQADVVLTDARPDEPGTAIVLLGRGQGEMETPLEFPIDGSPGSLDIADLNGDGWGDLVITHFSSSAVGVLLGSQDGTLGSEVEYYTNSFYQQNDPIRSSYPGPVSIADWDADGDLDLAVVNGGAGTVGLLRGHGDGTFSYSASYGTTVDPNELFMNGFASGDLNGDGRRDLAVGGALPAVLINSCR